MFAALDARLHRFGAGVSRSGALDGGSDLGSPLGKLQGFLGTKPAGV
jgi:hypothetical protein